MRLTPRYDGPPIIAIEGAADDQRTPLLRQRRRLQATLAGLDDDGWNAPSRCASWTVHDVVAHLVGVNAFWDASVRAGLAGTPTRMLAGFDPAATPPLMVGPMRALAPAEIFGQFVASNDALLGTVADLDESDWSTLAEAPPGHLPIRLLAQHALWDSWVHERDIALPLGVTPVAEPDELVSCLQYAAALSPAFALTTTGLSSGVFSIEATDPDVSIALDIGESVSVRTGRPSADAPCLSGNALELVEALSLRAPLPPSTPREWRAVLGGLATAFDNDLPS